MFIIANHHITDAAAFWASMSAAGAPPEGTKVHFMLPGTDGTSAVCLWEATDLDTVRRLVNGTVGTSSTNTFFAVAADRAMGLPR